MSSQPYVDPDDPTQVDFAPRLAAAIVPFGVVDGRPVNPCERIGIAGRGWLRLWGENQAADPVVVANEPGQRWILLINRVDGGGWAVPGGRVEPGESAGETLLRELAEETGLSLAGVAPQVVWAGFAHDPRNTDEAWMCTTVAVLAVPARLPVVAGDDAREAAWFRFGSLAELERDVADRVGGWLYGPQPPLLRAALDFLDNR